MSLDGDIRAALVTALDTITGLSTDDGTLRTSAYILDQVNPPIAMIRSGDVDYDGTFSHGQDERPFTILLFVDRVTVSGQVIIDELRETSGVTSVKAAIESDRTLGGLVDQVHVLSITAPKPVQIGDITYLCSDVSVRVITT